MVKVGEIELDSEGIRSLLKSSEVASECQKVASRVLGNTGRKGYSMGPRSYPERTGYAVYTTNKYGEKDNEQNNTLLKALG